MSGFPEPEQVNWTRYRAGQPAGHYESFFQRANHPTEPLAFWIRYTIFSPDGRPADAVGELWAIAFDGRTGEHAVARQAWPMAECSFAPDAFDVRIAGSRLGPGALRGAAGEIAWDLSYTGKQQPFFLLPPAGYNPDLPNAKTLVGVPLARFDGQLTVAGRTVEVADWVGSQNHNWGRAQAQHYVFGQLAGFDDAPDAFLEAITTRGPSGYRTLALLRLDGREHRFAAPGSPDFGPDGWEFSADGEDVAITGRLSAPPDAFVQLAYPNPPGGTKYCLNTKIAAATVRLTDTQSGSTRTLTAAHRGLFEIVTDDPAPGVDIRA